MGRHITLWEHLSKNLKDLKPFASKDVLWADIFDSGSSVPKDELSNKDYEKLASVSEKVYVLLSKGTPIGWCPLSSPNNWTVLEPASFNTRSRREHVRLLREALR